MPAKTKTVKRCAPTLAQQLGIAYARSVSREAQAAQTIALAQRLAGTVSR